MLQHGRKGKGITRLLQEMDKQRQEASSREGQHQRCFRPREKDQAPLGGFCREKLDHGDPGHGLRWRPSTAMDGEEQGQSTLGARRSQDSRREISRERE